MFSRVVAFGVPVFSPCQLQPSHLRDQASTPRVAGRATFTALGVIAWLDALETELTPVQLVPQTR